MPRIYVAVDPQLGRVEYRDRKRAWWLLSVAYPLLPFVGMAAHAATGREIALGLPLLISYGLMPLLDALIGEDPSNPPEAVVPQLEADRYYRWLTWITVPLHLVALMGCAWWVGTHALSWWALLMFAYVAGTDSGLGINTGHELGHKHNPWEQWLARLVLAVPAYGHFTVEHGRGHHRSVCTPQDHASARMGESIYRFALRELPGGVSRAWRLERERLAQLGRPAWSAGNTILQSYAITIALQLGLVIAFGWVMLPFLAVHNLVAWWQLTSANYVEHYGLLRAREPGGGYETPKPHHSWNTNHLVTNLALFHLQRHSDHHARPSRRYQSLRDFADLPRLPSGYFGMFPLSYLPWLWFKVMDPRLLALPHVAGDLDRVNLDPRRQQALRERYGDTRVEA
ncbi:alkane 1-monooxygenase [Pelomonas aquatica]|jgi:alkane 1-monooxygenase|uniref:Alkane 1-monooxygenase n=1 Tax=Pelomonas aquatica TaxID=431058 RepID=A0A9X4LK36_9BURK|nr:alkane 1-monooxygenase [Pelomonas aquatica]MCY4757035.1 alkane 1-monooxygenase [Pelomonas aquatica]MDG0864381.1 alkane 1-monooxygenase [Pelomonas aquatica]